VWRVEDFKLVGVKEAFHGQFFCGDSYVLHYAYDEVRIGPFPNPNTVRPHYSD
jgi:hypothetical protein